jgi:hypothetical protein
LESVLKLLDDLDDLQALLHVQRRVVIALGMLLVTGGVLLAGLLII